MSVPAAYLSVVLIWSTTPLAIQWSTQGAGFAFAVFARMAIGLVLAITLIAVWRIGLPLHARARRAYLVGGASLFGAMVLTYWGARFVHSGLVSVLFGMSPLMASLMAALWLGERSLTPLRLTGTVLGAVGLAIIFLDGDSLGGEHAAAGLVALLAAVAIYSAGLVGLKRIGDDSPPLATTVGSLMTSLPCFAVVWWLDGSGLPNDLPLRSASAIAYLGVFGSVLGFALYYYLIKHMEASQLALITLITPVMALLLGRALNDEVIGARVWMGAGLILLGLAIYQWCSIRGLFARRMVLAKESLR